MSIKNMTKSDSDGDFLLKAYAILNYSGDLFRFPTSSKQSVLDIASETTCDVVITRDTSNVCHDIAWDAEMFHYEKDDSGKLIKRSNTTTIHEVGNRVWINATKLKSGYSGGAKIYHIASTYAYNNGKVFIGDPAGLSPIAHYRRLENMMVSAIRLGTTHHLKPHPKQLKGLNVGGWKLNALEWEESDTAFNIFSMAKLCYNYIGKATPEIKDVAYDFEQGVFYDATNISTTDGEGTPIITEDQWKEIAAKRRARTDGIGCNTLKRAIVTHSLLQEAGRDSWNGVLEKLTEFTSSSGLGFASHVESNYRPRSLWV